MIIGMAREAQQSNSARSKHAVRAAVSSLCGADYELACAAKLLEGAGHPAASEAEALFQAALAFRQKLEAETNG